MMHLRLLFLALAASATVAAACGNTGPKYEIRGLSEGLRISVSAESLPPHAQEEVLWRVHVADAKTGQPVEHGMGAIWARTKDRTHEVTDAFDQARELGVYVGKLSLVMAGEWQMGVVFQKDSLSPRATIDWVQEARAIAASWQWRRTESVKHFFRSSLTPAQAIEAADSFFAELEISTKSSAARERVFSGELGEVRLTARPEGGHYTFVEASTDQMGESRLDRNVKRFFVTLHRMSDPRHQLEAAY